MSISPGLAAWKIAFQLSPIVLVNGLVQNFPGGILPIIAITEAVNFPLGLLSGGHNIELDGFFANFRPLPGSTLLDQDIGRYPFANQAVAANAVIAQPTVISMEMVCPARNRLGFFAKLAIMEALTSALKFHNSRGGTYIVATPSQIYNNCLFRTLRDTSGNDTNQPQHTWQWDFEKPLITMDDAASAQGGLMNWISRQTQITNPSWSGLPTAVGQPGTVTGPGVIPAASGSGVGPGTIAQGPLGGGGV